MNEFHQLHHAAGGGYDIHKLEFFIALAAMICHVAYYRRAMFSIFKRPK